MTSRVTGPDDLSALLGSRICHDLISPLGAIGNGVELLSMTGLNAAPEIALISESVENATARIRFFRIAFGATGGGAQIGLGEIRAILADLTRGGRLRIDWSGDIDPVRAEAKLAFLLLLCLETALPYGGRISVRHEGGAWRLDGTADRIKADPALWSLMLGQADGAELTASTVHFALVPDLARRLGRQLRTTLGDGAITISF
jgi:histidine phosphotransferase ChpT